MTTDMPLLDKSQYVLIVEDSATQARRLQHILERQGYAVAHAADGRQALDAARKRKPALIISDVIMPEMDGYELCLRVKSDPALEDVPVILVTTLSDPADVIRGLECRADNFILKPYDERYLLSRVQFVLVNGQMRQTERGGLSVEVFFNDRRHVITADRLQILNLLLSTYEAAIQRNKELTRAQKELTERGAVLAERERELQAARLFLEELVVSSPSIIFRLEPAGDDFRPVYVSPNLGQVLGYAGEEFMADPQLWKQIIHADDRETALAALRSALEAMTWQIEQEYRCRAKNGRDRWFLSTMRVEYDEQARVAAILCHWLDIDTRKRAEAALAESEARTRGILDTAYDAFVGIDADGKITEWNLAAEEIFGWPRADVVGRFLTENIIPPQYREAHDAGFAHLLRTGEGRILNERIEVTALRRSGQEFPIELLIWPLELGGKRIYNAFMRDITGRRRAEAAVKQAKEEAERANHAKSDFVSRMSHDLRTPLNAILGFAQLLGMDNLTTEQDENVQQILRAGAHLLDLINEVLDIARIESGHLALSPEPVSVVEVVQQAVELVRPLGAERGVSFTCELEPARGLHVLADRQRLIQILLNLLSNAVKYNRERGRVIVSFDALPAGRFRINVADTGAGIAPDRVPLLFQPFQRLDAAESGIEGTGLGLALSKALAEVMGGTLDVVSEVDRGSTFRVELALAERYAAPDKGPAPAGAPASAQDSGVSGTVLYIEDNVSNRRLMERVLVRRPGVKLIGVAQGQAGLDLARAAPPDLILLDLHLADMRGEEVLRRLWEDPRTRIIPVAVLSADATPSQITRLLASGATAYLTKPLDISQVLQLIDSRLKPSSGEEPNQGGGG